MPTGLQSEPDNRADAYLSAQYSGIEQAVILLPGQAAKIESPSSSSQLPVLGICRNPGSAESLETWCYMSPDEQWQGPFDIVQLQAWRDALPMDLWLCRATQPSGTLQNPLACCLPPTTALIKASTVTLIAFTMLEFNSAPKMW